MTWNLIFLAEMLQSAFLPFYIFDGPLTLRAPNWLRTLTLFCIGVLTVGLWRQLCSVASGPLQIRLSALSWLVLFFLLCGTAMFLYGGDWRMRLMICCTAVASSNLMTTLPWLFYGMLMRLPPPASYRSVWDMLRSPWDYPLIFFSYLAMAWALRRLLCRHYDLFIRQGRAHWAALACGISAVALCLGVSACSFWQVIRGDGRVFWLLFGPDAAVMLAIAIGLAVVANDQEKRALREEMEQLEQEQERQDRRYRERLASEEELYALQHDLRKHVRILRADLAEGRPDEAAAYLEELAEDYDHILTLMPVTGNRVADLLLGDAAHRCHAAGCTFAAQGKIPPALPRVGAAAAEAAGPEGCRRRMSAAPLVKTRILR